MGREEKIKALKDILMSCGDTQDFLELVADMYDEFNTENLDPKWDDYEPQKLDADAASKLIRECAAGVGVLEQTWL